MYYMCGDIYRVYASNEAGNCISFYSPIIILVFVVFARSSHGLWTVKTCRHMGGGVISTTIRR